MDRHRWVSILLRLTVAVSFLYPPVSAFFNPLTWVGYFPSFILALPISDIAILHAFGAVEAIIGVWILFGRRVFYPALAAAAILLAITVINFNQIDVLFRDIALALAALALALFEYSPKEHVDPQSAPVSAQ